MINYWHFISGPQGPQLQKVLERLTGQYTVPNVFIGKQQSLSFSNSPFTLDMENYVTFCIEISVLDSVFLYITFFKSRSFFNSIMLYSN